MAEEVRNLSHRLVFQSYPLPFPKMSTLHRLNPCLLTLAAVLAGVTSGQAIDLESLVKNSPFGAAAGPTAANAAPGTLEFRGMYADGGVNYYSIYNALTKQSTWVAEGEAPSVNVPVTVKGFDLVNESLLVDNAGQPQKMELHQAVIVKYSGPAPAPMISAVNNGIAPGAAGMAAGVAMPQMTPEQVEAFRNSMRERFSNGAARNGNPNAAAASPGGAVAVPGAASAAPAGKSQNNKPSKANRSPKAN